MYVDWTAEQLARPFYVGKGDQNRIGGFDRNKVHTRIKLMYGMRREVVFRSTDEDAAFDEEKRLIQEHKTFANGGAGWWGANLTLGGKCMLGLVRTDEHRQHLSETWQRDEGRRIAQSKKMREKNPSHLFPDTDETRQKKREGQQQRYSDPLEREKTSNSTKLACQNLEVFKKRSEAQKTRRKREREAREACKNI